MNPEDWLIARIDARQAIRGLTPRLREMLRRHYRYGETYREIAAAKGISYERVRQLIILAEKRLRRALGPPKRAWALPPPPPPPKPPGFDRAAFLAHMRKLIELRDANTTAEFERDLAELHRLVEQERQWDVQHATANLVAVYKAEQAKQKAEREAREREAARARLEQIARNALAHLMAARQPRHPGTPDRLGHWCTDCALTHDANPNEAMRRLLAEIPPDAKLSACPRPVPDPDTGTIAGNAYASLRVFLIDDGYRVRIDCTWDHPSYRPPSNR